MSDLFVVVNMSQSIYMGMLGEQWHAIMPSEDPHTYPTLEEAVEHLATLAEEYGHDVHSAPIFRLAPVDPEEVERLLVKELASRDE